MNLLTLRNYESQKLTLLNPSAIVSVRVEADTHGPSRLYLVIEQTNRPDPGLYYPINERGTEDWKQTDPERALNNMRAVLAGL